MEGKRGTERKRERERKRKREKKLWDGAVVGAWRAKKGGAKGRTA